MGFLVTHEFYHWKEGAGKNEKKAAVLRAAKKLFAQKGYHNVAMQAIAEECKMSKACIYKLFQSKEDLLLALIKFRKHEEMLNKSAVIDTGNLADAERKIPLKKSLWRLRNSVKTANLSISSPMRDHLRIPQYLKSI